jgi:hypothetical protein
MTTYTVLPPKKPHKSNYYYIIINLKTTIRKTENCAQVTSNKYFVIFVY